MQQPQPPVNLQSPPSHAKQRLDGIAEAAAEASEDGASSDSSMDEAGLQRIAEHHHAPRAQPFGQHARSPEPVAPEDLIPDSAEPALQSHPPQDTTMPDAGPVTQTVPAELPDVVPDSAEPDPEPDPAAADEQAAGDRGDRMQDQDMGGGQDVHAGPPSPAKLSEEENVRAWSACRMHFAPGRTRHDRVSRTNSGSTGLFHLVFQPPMRLALQSEEQRLKHQRQSICLLQLRLALHVLLQLPPIHQIA